MRAISIIPIFHPLFSHLFQASPTCTITIVVSRYDGNEISESFVLSETCDFGVAVKVLMELLEKLKRERSNAVLRNCQRKSEIDRS